MTFLFELGLQALITVLTSILSFFVYITAQHFWSRWLLRQMRNKAAEYAKIHQARDHALVVSVLTDIQQDVRSFLAAQSMQDMPMTSEHRKDGLSLEPADWLLMLDNVKHKVRQIREAGVDRFHLFSNCPIAMTTMVGALLGNGPEVVIYHFTGGRYYPVGRITPEHTKL